MERTSDIMRHKYFNHVVTKFQVDSSYLTSDKTKPNHCPNSAPLYIPMPVVNNSAPLYRVYKKVDTLKPQIRLPEIHCINLGYPLMLSVSAVRLNLNVLIP